MKIITVDFETYYDKEYSLSKLTTEEYVRDERFEVIGVGIKEGDKDTLWLGPRTAGHLFRKYDFSSCAVLCHNTVFDGAILSWHYGVRPALWLDTLSMARPLNKVTTGLSLKALAAHYGVGEKGDEVIRALGKHRSDFTMQELRDYGDYCKTDVDLTHKLYKAMRKHFTVEELMLIDQTLRMYTEPMVQLDTGLLEKHLEDIKTNKAQLVDELGLSCTEEEAKSILASGPKFAEFLEGLGVDVPMKTSKTTGNLTYAFAKSDAGMKKLMKHEDDRVRAAVEARLGVKSTIDETRTKRFIDISYRGSLPIMLNYYGAHTGRFSGGDKINLQNLPRGGTLRKALKAPKGHVLVACDSSQIEARMVAWLAGQQDLLDAFTAQEDVYKLFASKLYGVPQEHITDEQRFVGKTCILGLGYGMGADKLQSQLAAGIGGKVVYMTNNEARNAVTVYRRSNFKINQLWNIGGEALRTIYHGSTGKLGPLDVTGEGIHLPTGFALSYPALQPTVSGYVYANNIGQYRKLAAARLRGEQPPDDVTYIYGGKVIENVTQACARAVVAYQGLDIGKRYPVVFQVHDEIVACVPERQAEEAKSYMEQVMSTPPDWAPDLPVACEAAYGENYGDAK
jgi:DNA polymerase I-like protein with 3'-5' exonuclease and polymerase domains